MTRVVDIEARAMERDTYKPLFRVNDIDRRRDRKVVWRQNDGPGMTWEERVARSQALLAKLNKNARPADSMVMGHVLLPVLRAISEGIDTQKTIAEATKKGVGTIAARVSEALRQGLIVSRRDRTQKGCAVYRLTKDGEAFMASYQVKKPDDFERSVAPKATYTPPPSRRHEVLTFLADGQWRQAIEIAEYMGRVSNQASAAVRRCVEAGYAEQMGGTGIGTRAAYRITAEGLDYLASLPA